MNRVTEFVGKMFSEEFRRHVELPQASYYCPETGLRQPLNDLLNLEKSKDNYFPSYLKFILDNNLPLPQAYYHIEDQVYKLNQSKTSRSLEEEIMVDINHCFINGKLMGSSFFPNFIVTLNNYFSSPEVSQEIKKILFNHYLETQKVHYG